MAVLYKYSHAEKGSIQLPKSSIYWKALRICKKQNLSVAQLFLANLSQRLIGELIGFSWSSVHPSCIVVINNFKHLLLQNRLPDQSQILCGASLGRGNESLFAASGSHDQDGRQAHIKTLQKSSSPEPAGRFSQNLVCSIGDASPS